ncbi:MAG: Uncharacterised protein [Gammaproteobacteria bacterium]|nr:MAG: Uncharacterised protein [Gammaproteobacteria bacterium]
MIQNIGTQCRSNNTGHNDAYRCQGREATDTLSDTHRYGRGHALRRQRQNRLLRRLKQLGYEYCRHRGRRRAQNERDRKGTETTPHCLEEPRHRDSERHGRRAEQEMHELGALEISPVVNPGHCQTNGDQDDGNQDRVQDWYSSRLLI